jgi:hypothetical protein
MLQQAARVLEEAEKEQSAVGNATDVTADDASSEVDTGVAFSVPVAVMGVAAL